MVSDTLPTLKAGFETTGSTRWIMQAIQHLGLDREQGFALDLILHHKQGDAQKTSPEASLLAGQIDLIDTDWLSICRARAAGTQLAAVSPYGRIMGGLITHDAAQIASPADLIDKRIGLLRKTDKNWKVLRAWVKQQHGFDPEDRCEVQVFPSKMELEAQIRDRNVDAAIIFWHRIPELLKNPGLHEVCDMVDLVEGLIEASPATTFFVFREDFVKNQPHVVEGFRHACGQAIHALSSQPEFWGSITGLTPPVDPSASSYALFTRWRRRMVTEWSETDYHDLMRLHQIISRVDSQAVLSPDRAWFPSVLTETRSVDTAMEVSQ